MKGHASFYGILSHWSSEYLPESSWVIQQPEELFCSKPIPLSALINSQEQIQTSTDIMSILSGNWVFTNRQLSHNVSTVSCWLISTTFADF